MDELYTMGRPRQMPFVEASRRLCADVARSLRGDPFAYTHGTTRRLRL